MRLLDDVAEGYEGVNGTSRSFQEGSTIVLILREDVDPAATARGFARAFCTRLNEMHEDELQELTGGLTPPKTALAVSSGASTWHRHE